MQGPPLSSATYTGLDRTTELDKVESELQRIINAQPTQVHPDEREAFLKAILSDLADEESAPWTIWPSSLYLSSLTALKCLSRNPVGSTLILSNFRAILHHTSLPLPPPASPFSHPPNEPEHPTSLEALKILANALVLHNAAGRIFTEIGGGKAVAKALKDGHISSERLFLLGRIGFLATVDRREVVRQMVDKEGLVESLATHLNSTPPVSANFSALAEILKLTSNVVRFYPSQPEEWSSKLAPLLQPTLSLFHHIPFDDIAPPLSNAMHVLLLIPFTPDLLSTWSHIPRPLSLSLSPPTTLDKLSSLLIGQPRRSADSIRDAISLSPPTKPQNGRRSPSPTRSDDPTLLPARILKIVGAFFERYLPYRKDPDDELPKGLVMDHVLPPVLAVLVNAVRGSSEIRTFTKNMILPTSLDRSTEAGPLEKRPGVLGNLLRLMNAASHTSSRDTAGELLWAICESDPSTFSTEIGYGNAAGFLFRKGLSGPPPAKIEEIPDAPVSAQARHPITSLAPPTVESHDPLDDMSQEEKEREAEKLFVLFDRMEKNPVISMNSGDKGGGGSKKTPRDLMREKLASGELEGVDKEEDKEREEEERRDEEEAMADLRRYKERMGKK